jgi:hypothetical protein
VSHIELPAEHIMTLGGCTRYGPMTTTAPVGQRGSSGRLGGVWGGSWDHLARDRSTRRWNARLASAELCTRRASCTLHEVEGARCSSCRACYRLSNGAWFASNGAQTKKLRRSTSCCVLVATQSAGVHRAHATPPSAGKCTLSNIVKAACCCMHCAKRARMCSSRSFKLSRMSTHHANFACVVHGHTSTD